jgi:hypothetical protein
MHTHHATGALSPVCVGQTGQLKSTLACPDPACGHVSVTFDPLQHLVRGDPRLDARRFPNSCAVADPGRSCTACSFENLARPKKMRDCLPNQRQQKLFPDACLTATDSSNGSPPNRCSCPNRYSCPNLPLQPPPVSTVILRRRVVAMTY